MSATNAQRPLLDELFDDLEKRYKSPSPETLALKARSFERLLHRYVLLLVGVNGSLVAMLALIKQAQLPAATGVAVALGGAALSAVLASRSQPSDHWTRSLLWGASAVLVLLAAEAQPATALTLIVTIVLAAATTALVVAGKWPQGVVPVYVLQQVLIWQVFPPEGDMARMVTEALVLLPMLAILAWQRLGIAATGAMIGIALVAALEALAQERNSALALSVLLGFFLAVGVVYEMRIQLNRRATLRQTARIGIAVLLIYLFVASLSKLLPGIAWGDAGIYWLTALLVASYQSIRIRRDLPSLPLRLPWMALCVVVAVLNDPRLGWVASQLLLLAVVALLHLVSLKVRSRSLSNVAVVLLAGLAANSLWRSLLFSDLGIIAVTAVTFASWLVIAARPSYPPPPAAAEPTQPGITRRILLFLLGTLLRVPLVSWLFYWAKTAFVWLRYFRSATQPLVLNDLLFCAAHAYGAVVTTRQVLQRCVDLQWGELALALTAVLVPTAWGLMLVARAPRADQLYRRMFGVVMILVPAGLHIWKEVADIASADANNRLTWMAIVIGLALCLASWLVLRGDHAESTAATPQDAADATDATG